MAARAMRRFNAYIYDICQGHGRSTGGWKRGLLTMRAAGMIQQSSITWYNQRCHTLYLMSVSLFPG